MGDNSFLEEVTGPLYHTDLGYMILLLCGGILHPSEARTDRDPLSLSPTDANRVIRVLELNRALGSSSERLDLFPWGRLLERIYLEIALRCSMNG